jgi:phosphoglycerate dehydrogenase-like enzyme
VNATHWSNPVVLVAHTKMAPELASHLAVETPVLCTDSIADLPADVLADVDVLVGHQIPPGALRLLPNLRWLHLTGTGTDHLPAAGLAPQVTVTTSARVPVESVAEYAISALLMLLKDLPTLSQRPQRRPWYTSSALMLHGSTVLVVGAGRIGQAVVRRLTALGAHCLAVTRTGAVPVPGADRTVGVDRLTQAAASADHIVCCLPASPGTANLIDKDVLAALPGHAVLVNVGRATTVEDTALHAALRSHKLRGALLDVHRVEPLPPDDPAWTVPNLILSPHCAFAFPDEPASVGQAFLDNLADLRAGQPPRDLVAVHSGDPDR